MEDLTNTLLYLNNGLIVTTRGYKMEPPVIEKVVKLAQQFLTTFKRLSPDQKEIFTDRERVALRKSKELLALAIRTDARFRSILDKMPQLRKYDPQDLSISHVFEEFIKGITYFSIETPASTTVPIYHRLYSCGPRSSESFADVLTECHPDPNNEGGHHRRKAELRIEKCYIERLIYDAIFRNLDLHFPYYDESDVVLSQSAVKLQDKGHREWLKETADAFKLCFPNTDFQVSVGFDGIIPLQVRIVKTIRGKPRKIWLCTKQRIKSFDPNKCIYEEDCEKLIWDGRKYLQQATNFFNEGPIYPIISRDPAPSIELSPQGSQIPYRIIATEMKATGI